MKTFLNTVDTTVQFVDGSEPLRAFVITGDIGDEWLRDSAMQVEPYLAVAGESEAVRALLVAVSREHAFLALMDPYANSFHDPPRWHDTRRGLRRGGYVATGNYELDSWAFAVRLAHGLWRRANCTEHLDQAFRLASQAMLVVWKKEQDHDRASTYHYEELRDGNGHRNAHSARTGMVWTAFRPSDDPVQYHYHVPANMLSSAALRQTAEMARAVYQDAAWAAQCNQLADEIDAGIEKFGVVEVAEGGPTIYAYEVDGKGNVNLMDDANVPSLLSIPMLGWSPYDDDVYRRTRQHVLSQANPFYFEGSAAKGVGSPHTPSQYVWPMSLIVQALTSTDPQERQALLDVLVATDANTNLMHESFDVNNPSAFTRHWFAWANSLFSLLIIDLFF